MGLILKLLLAPNESPQVCQGRVTWPGKSSGLKGKVTTTHLASDIRVNAGRRTHLHYVIRAPGTGVLPRTFSYMLRTKWSDTLHCQ